MSFISGSCWHHLGIKGHGYPFPPSLPISYGLSFFCPYSILHLSSVDLSNNYKCLSTTLSPSLSPSNDMFLYFLVTLCDSHTISFFFNFLFYKYSYLHTNPPIRSPSHAPHPCPKDSISFFTQVRNMDTQTGCYVVFKFPFPNKLDHYF